MLIIVHGAAEPVLHAGQLPIVPGFGIFHIPGGRPQKAVLHGAAHHAAHHAGTFLLTYTTSPIALTDGLERLLNPLKKLKIPVHEMAMMMSMALRFIPTLIEETDKIMSAQKARGADFETRQPDAAGQGPAAACWCRCSCRAFRRADELAVAMECRCYHGGEGRTRMKQLRYAPRDAWALILGAAFLAGVIVLKKFGL
jgi:energy-coupling factor transport system permease protein